jgi:hypothetical protein
VYAGGNGNVFGGSVGNATGMAIGSNASPGPDIRFNSANTTYTGMAIQRVGTERWYIGVDNSSANGNVVIRNNANLNILGISEVLGGNASNSGNGYYNGGKFSFSRNTLGNVTITNDEFVTIGSNNYTATPVVLGIQSANGTYSGIRWSKAPGTEGAFLGFDNSGSTGNFILNMPSNGSTIQVLKVVNSNTSSTTGNLTQIRAGVPIFQTFYRYDAYQNITTITNASDTLLVVNSTVNSNTAMTAGILTFNANGVITNSSGAGLNVLVSWTVPWAANTSGARVSWIQGGTGTGASANRFGMVNTSTSPDFTVHSGTAIVQLAAGDGFSMWCWQNSGASQQIGGAFSGLTANNSTRLTVTVLG